MSAARPALQLLLLTFAGWVNRHQQHASEYLLEENRVLREQLGSKRLRLADDQRRRLAAKAIKLGHDVLARVTSIVTPDTILRWHRQLVAQKWSFAAKRPGRPGLMRGIAELIVRMARENPTWGYRRIQGELRALGHTVAAATVANVLKSHGIRPAPERPSSWRAFLNAHMGEIAATDFSDVEGWIGGRLQTYDVLFVIDVESRIVHLAGITTEPAEAFMAQVARNLTATVDGFLARHRYLICDRDTKFTAQFAATLLAAGVQIVRTPVRAPNCNAFAERFVLSIRRECLDRLVLIGEKALRNAVVQYLAHYNAERAHQGVGNRRLGGAPTFEAAQSGSSAPGEIICDERLGGLLKAYRRAG